MWGSGLDSSGTGKGPMEGSCEYGNEPFGSINRQWISWLAIRTVIHGVSLWDSKISG